MPTTLEELQQHTAGLTEAQQAAWFRVFSRTMETCGCEGKALTRAQEAAEAVAAGERVIFEAELSHDDIRQALHTALKAVTPNRAGYYCYVRDVFDDRVVYEEETPEGVTTYQRAYAIDDTGRVTLGDPAKVVRKTVYVPVGEAGRMISAANLAELEAALTALVQAAGRLEALMKRAQGEDVSAQEVIRKEGDKWVLYSSDGTRKLGEFDTREDALKRERQIQFFKRQHEAATVIPEPDVVVDLDGYVPSEEELAAALKVVQALLQQLGEDGDAEEAKRGGNVQRLISTFGRWAGGKHTGCVAQLRGKAGISDPARLCAWLKDRYTGTTTWRGKKHKESAEAELAGDLVPLVEKAVRRDGTVPIKVIDPGWGTSGYYSAEVLQRDGPKVFRAGTHMYLDHPTATETLERPERSVKDLAGVLVSDARWVEDGPAGPGLYADAKVFGEVRELLDEIAPHIGVSIRASGKAVQGEAEGRKGPVIEAITQAHSVDFVTLPGRGGRVLEIIEAARGRRESTGKEVGGMSDELREALAAKEAAEARVKELEEANRQQAEDLARLREAAVLREAREKAQAALAKVDLPDVTKTRLVESVSANPPVQDGQLDEAAFARRVQEAVKQEAEYLAKLGAGAVRGLGSADAASGEDAQKRLEEAMLRIMGDEQAAKIAAQGRN